MIEPFGYFRAEPFGWTDCSETDEGAVPLYDQAVVTNLQQQLAHMTDDAFGLRVMLREAKKQRDELLAALEYHQEQTRPIQATIDLISRVKGGAA